MTVIAIYFPIHRLQCCKLLINKYIIIFGNYGIFFISNSLNIILYIPYVYIYVYVFILFSNIFCI